MCVSVFECLCERKRDGSLLSVFSFSAVFLHINMKRRRKKESMREKSVDSTLNYIYSMIRPIKNDESNNCPHQGIMTWVKVQSSL